MTNFTAAELKMIQQGLVLLKAKGPGWPVTSQDGFKNFCSEVDVLMLKLGKPVEVEQKPVPKYDSSPISAQDRMLKAMHFRG